MRFYLWGFFKTKTTCVFVPDFVSPPEVSLVWTFISLKGKTEVDGRTVIEIGMGVRIWTRR